ncbi:hypothetical protein [Botrimarina hoheduenensis]|uniref:Uncharacterized protein n=1 Tax=Botrimarina hoheduenensis TaxID=2528000 RepID=A0A5C5W6F2_9BACT|nr:hypothetical protein [Botrimarina hoheduenensis]TWT46466.1 hypothetical protein Pla111_15620 [Botrimarina hoheduenensis]
MTKTARRIALTIVPVTLAAFALPALADDHGWDGRRVVSEQRPNDLFYNYYVGPQPSGTAAQMYVSPLPVPANVGHTYTTYQPVMPHEYLYQHHRSWNTHHPGAGWTRTKARYHSRANGLQAGMWGLYDNSFTGWLHNGYFNTRVVKPWQLY